MHKSLRDGAVLVLSIGRYGRRIAPAHFVTGCRFAMPRVLFRVQLSARIGQRHVTQIIRAPCAARGRHRSGVTRWCA